MSNEFTRIVGELKFLQVYRCSICGFGQTGETERLEIDVSSPIEVARALENVRPSGYYMPVGWSSHYGNPRNILKCPTCQKSAVVD